MKRILLILLVLGALAAALMSSLPSRGAGSSPLAQLRERFAKKPKPSVDHTQFERLKQPFKKPQDVTFPREATR
jgi:hypothetical protein